MAAGARHRRGEAQTGCRLMGSCLLRPDAQFRCLLSWPGIKLTPPWTFLAADHHSPIRSDLLAHALARTSGIRSSTHRIAPHRISQRTGRPSQSRQHQHQQQHQQQQQQQQPSRSLISTCSAASGQSTCNHLSQTTHRLLSRPPLAHSGPLTLSVTRSHGRRCPSGSTTPARRAVAVPAPPPARGCVALGPASLLPPPRPPRRPSCRPSLRPPR
ncbi:hypothetical protein BC831DRAFT_11267 [Entophlyctis helioformis]|nr:hypothetical protein BC831DRAFT_11267 [Entophlyctis helioformis]